MRCLTELKQLLLAVEPIVLNRDFLSQPIIRMATDAASPERPGLGGWLEQGKGVVWSLFWPIPKIKFWKRTKAKATKNHIGIWELMAVLGSILVFQDELAEKKLYAYVDNLGDVFALIKATCNCRVSRAIVRLILECLREIKCTVYFVYLNTNRNPSDALTRIDKLKKLNSKLEWRQAPDWNLTVEVINSYIEQSFEVQ